MLGGAEAEDRVAKAVVVNRRVRRVVSVARRQCLQDDLNLHDRRAGVGKVDVGKIVQRVFGQHVGLALVREIDAAQLAQWGQAEIAIFVDDQIAGRYRIDLGHDGRRVDPVHYLIFIA